MRKSKRLAVILENCRIGVQNAESDQEIKTAIAPYGYTDEKLQPGLASYQETFDLSTVQGKEKQDVREVTDQFTE